MFENVRQERSHRFLPSLTDTAILKLGKFIDFETIIIKKLAIENLRW